MDDVTPELYWGRGPSAAWREAEAKHMLTTVGVYEVQGSNPTRRWALGKFTDLDE